MGFNAQKFVNDKSREKRTAIVKVPELKDYFDKAPYEWEIRGLSGTELARANDAIVRTKQIGPIMEALAKQGKASADAVKSIFGLDDAVPDDIARRIEHLIAGSVNPECDRETAIRLFEDFPVVAFQISNRILELTGEGAVSGKPKPSTRKAVSETA